MNEQRSVSTLVEQWEAARMRSFLARHTHGAIEDLADHWADLRLSTAISRNVLAGRWCVVADLLRLGAVASWAEVGDALDVTEVDAHDGFLQWLAGQVALFGDCGIGVSPAEGDELRALADEVIL